MNQAEDIEELLERARREPPRRRAPAPAPAPPRPFPGYAVRTNRRAVRRRGSAFLIAAGLAAAAAVAVLYIGNILAVNRLADDVNLLRTKLQDRRNATGILLAEIDRASTWDSIAAPAARLGLRPATEQPAVLAVPEERVREAAP